jgi:hypothetical protein
MKKSLRKMLGTTLQEFELVPVTDPVEFATLDRRCRAAKKAIVKVKRKPGKHKPGGKQAQETWRG